MNNKAGNIKVESEVQCSNTEPGTVKGEVLTSDNVSPQLKLEPNYYCITSEQIKTANSKQSCTKTEQTEFINNWEVFDVYNEIKSESGYKKHTTEKLTNCSAPGNDNIINGDNPYTHTYTHTHTHHTTHHDTFIVIRTQVTSPTPTNHNNAANA